jgi:hypothetical protein
MYVAEYNPKQKCFHIETKNSKGKKVLEAILGDDWKNESEWIVFFEGSQKECGKKCEELQNILEKKGEKEGDKNKYIANWLNLLLC